MKFCSVVSEICRGQVHVPKKERRRRKRKRKRKRIIIIITRYDYNLTIMKSPKPASDNRFKK
jgi:ribosome maturation protein Sdo1